MRHTGGGEVRAFEDDSGRPRVVFGSGAVERVPDELTRLGVRRALVLSTPGRRALAERVEVLLVDAAAGVFAGAVMHTPVEVTARAVVEAERLGADAVVSVGGGSTTGLGKALASRAGLAHLVVATTYSGSEVTPVLGETEDGVKTTRSDPSILPDTVVYDVDLTTSLPWSTTVTSAVNAMAHAVEALYSADRTPETDRRAAEALAALARGLREEDRSDLLYGAHLAGRCLAATGMGLHHKLCHTLGGSFGLPHAETHTVVLPHAMAYNATDAREAMATVAHALDVEDAPSGLQELVRTLGGPTDLAALGLTAEDVPRAVELATAAPYPNPHPVTPAGLEDLLTRALDGDPP